MFDEEKRSGAQKYIGLAISVACFVSAMIVTPTLGPWGIAAIAVGWVSYNFSKDKVGTIFAISIGAAAGLAIYGLATVAVAILLNYSGNP